MATSERMSSADVRVDSRRAGHKWFTMFLVLSVLGLGVLVVMLTRENRQLRAMLQASQATYPPDAIKAGDLVPAMRLVSRGGEEVAEDFRRRAGEQTLVLLVGGHCPYCLETLPRWSSLVAKLQGSGLRVICIQSDAKTPAEMMDLPEHIPVEPGAVLIGPDGVVVRTWYGVPSEAQLEELARAVLGG